MGKLSSDEKAAFAALMSKLLEDDASEDMAAAIEADAAASVERAEVYAQAEADDLAARQAHELAVIDAQADATVRVIEAEADAAERVAHVEADATVAAAAELGASAPAELEVDLPDTADDVLGDPLEAAADVLAEMTDDTPEAPAVPVLELPDVPAVDDVVDDIAPGATHWWTKPRFGKRK
ncbi:MAG: hypothetical protein AB7H92_18655 [Microbacteriaceae bacterium]